MVQRILTQKMPVNKREKASIKGRKPKNKEPPSLNSSEALGNRPYKLRDDGGTREEEGGKEEKIANLRTTK